MTVRGFNKYIIKENGELYNFRFKLPRRIKGSIVGCGYAQIKLRKDGILERRYLHRIVAEAFIPNPLGKEQVNHIDGDKLNNNASNLEWVTPSENMKHAIKAGLLKPQIQNLRYKGGIRKYPAKMNPYHDKNRGKWVLQSNAIDYKYFKRFNTIIEAENMAEQIWIEQSAHKDS